MHLENGDRKWGKWENGDSPFSSFLLYCIRWLQLFLEPRRTNIAFFRIGDILVPLRQNGEVTHPGPCGPFLLVLRGI